jgi:hypothetical protein
MWKLPLFSGNFNQKPSDEFLAFGPGELRGQHARPEGSHDQGGHSSQTLVHFHGQKLCKLPLILQLLSNFDGILGGTGKFAWQLMTGGGYFS